MRPLQSYIARKRAWQADYYKDAAQPAATRQVLRAFRRRQQKRMVADGPLRVIKFTLTPAQVREENRK